MPEPIKIGIYLPNAKIDVVLLSDPEKGNPGIGGTQFLMFSLPYYMKKFYPERFEFIIFAETASILDTHFQVVVAKDLEEAAHQAKALKCSIFIFRPNSDKETRNLLSAIRNLELHSIAWMHNTNRFILNRLSANEYVVRCICVGRDQYETLRDHQIIKKLSLIYNAIDPLCFPVTEYEKEKTVVFLGSLTLAKGFHTLARQWKKILSYHPDAKLIVVGSGQLYDRSRRLGPLNLAEAEYEKLFRKYILNSKGQIHESIKFMGTLGPEKIHILSRASIGVVANPFFRETFCLSAVEFQLCGTPVVSRTYGGLLDTVLNNTGGFLRNNRKKRLECIIKLLSDQKLSRQMGVAGRDYVIDRFSYERICKDWNNVLEDVRIGKENNILELRKTDIRFIDRYREHMRILKNKIPFFRIIIPSFYLLHSSEFLRLRLQKFTYKLLSLFP